MMNELFVEHSEVFAIIRPLTVALFGNRGIERALDSVLAQETLMRLVAWPSGGFELRYTGDANFLVRRTVIGGGVAALGVMYTAAAVVLAQEVIDTGLAPRRVHVLSGRKRPLTDTTLPLAAAASLLLAQGLARMVRP